MSKTKHLDAAIALLRGNPSAKRAKSKFGVTLEVWVADGAYTIVANGKTVEAGEGNDEYAKARARTRADAIAKLGPTVTTYFY